MKVAPAPFAAMLPPLLTGRRVAVMGSASGLGLAVARAAEAAGAEVIGIDDRRGFEAVSALVLADLHDPGALDAAAAQLPDDLDALALFPDPGQGGPAQVLARALVAPRHLAQALAPRMAPGGAIVLRGAPPHAARSARLAEVRAAMALRHGDADGFAARWGLDAEPGRTLSTVGWALQSWAMAKCRAWADRGIRLNAVLPATPDGLLPPAVVAAGRSGGAQAGTEAAARAALFLMSPLSAGITGATLAADFGLSATISTSLDGL